MSERKTKPCPGGCTHSDEQHAAFDLGVAAGGSGLEEFEHVIVESLRYDYLAGYSAGRPTKSKEN